MNNLDFWVSYPSFLLFSFLETNKPPIVSPIIETITAINENL